MVDNSNLERILRTLNRLFASLPAAVPYAGNVYTTFRSDLDNAEVKQILEEIRKLDAEQREDLSQLMKVTKKAFDTLTKQLKKVTSQPQKEKLVAVVPVGGSAGSMFPISAVMPKCLIYVGKRTMLQHILNSFVPFPDVFKKVIVVTRQFNETIRENVRQGGYGEFVECKQIEKNVPGALLELKSELEQGPFLLHYNDILISKIDWSEVNERYMSTQKRKKISGMLLCSSFYPAGIGIISEKDGDMLDSFEEKPIHMQASGLANLGVCIFSPEILTLLHHKDEGFFEDSFKRILSNGERMAIFRVGEWHHVHALHHIFDIQKLKGAIN